MQCRWDNARQQALRNLAVGEHDAQLAPDAQATFVFALKRIGAGQVNRPAVDHELPPGDARVYRERRCER